MSPDDATPLLGRPPKRPRKSAERRRPACWSGAVEWNGAVASHAGPVNVYVAFAPNRSRVRSATLGGVAASTFAGAKPSILRVAGVQLDGAGRLVFATDSFGERPRVSALSIQPRGAPDPDAAGRRDVLQQLAVQWRELLETRAKTPFERYPLESDFFLKFDAWTNSAIAEWLVEPQHDAFRLSLDEPARRKFVEGLAKLPFPFHEAEALTDVARLLYEVALTRGYAMPNGDEGPFAMGEISALRLAPAQSQEEALDLIATYLKAMFEQLLGPDCCIARARGKLAPLERAFALFAGGHLAFVPADVADDIASALNCEPDSAYFHCFAEFALRACEREPEGPSWWFPVARLFVALQDVFAFTYGPRLGPRRFEAYARRNRARTLLPLEEIEAHVRRFEQDYPDRGWLADLGEIHAANVLHAARDEIFEEKKKEAAASGG